MINLPQGNKRLKETKGNRHNKRFSLDDETVLSQIVSVRRMETQNSVSSALDSGERTRENHKPGGSTIYKLVGISFGLLCVIQSSLNVYMWLQVVSADDIRGVLLERDQILREKEQLNQFIDQLLQEKDKLLEENSQLNRDKNQLIREKDKLLEEKAQLNRDKNQLIQEKDKLLEEKAQLNRDKNQLIQEKDKLLEEKAQLNRDKNQLIREKDKLLEEKTQLNRDKNQLIREKDKLLEEKAQLNRDKNQLIREKDKLLKENSRLNQALLNLPSCSPEWKRFRSSCYQISSFESTWEDAKQNCERHGAHLVIISDDAEKDFVGSYGQAVHFWIGLKYQWNYMSSMWTSKWVDGSQLCYNNFRETSSFSSSTPWNSAYTCAYQSATWYIWYTAECSKIYYWMCEKELKVLA
ncbi:C-type lectin domain family 4 member G isoform X2 [Oreochromis niloticus]|uniref:C-type lectin domain family 4 member G isoform X2 n=1 Tax=Oreochromis niloticus TaxID=8128 RepID=UPI0009052A17|nr:C-type lectin domain family 4 member G isoform X2 [Oreochromis niloticus]